MSTILQWNARSIATSLSELKRFLSQQTMLPDIMCIQETWLQNTNTNFRLDGYQIERADRNSGRGGGVATFVKDGLSYVRLPNPTILEALIIRVKLQSRNVTVVNVYHAPDALDASTTEQQYKLLFQTFNRDVIILGDLNAYSRAFGASMANCPCWRN